MKKYSYTDLSKNERKRLCRRPKMDFKSIFSQVEPIVNEVEARGDAAVLDFTEQFDGVRPKPLAFDPSAIEISLRQTNRKAIDTAFQNIHLFHEAEMPAPLEIETMPGVQCRRVARPIQRVGLYIPGGSAPLASTLLMLGVPAQIADCEEIVIATPPDEHGQIDDEIVYIARQIGADIILKAGGAQAIAAMAWGTESVPKVDKIFGPGNQYVTAAKMMLQNSEAQVAIDMPAGPSEVLVIADEQANPAFVAADLLSQAEHGPDSQVVLISTVGFDLDVCLQSLDDQLENLPRRAIAKQSIDQSFALQVESLSQAFSFSNEYAPEHLIVNCAEASQYQDHIINAGSVFLGPWTPESVGDYASGTNHTLPTYGYARMYSGVSVHSFLKFITMQKLSKNGLRTLGPTVETLAELETLEGHKRAVSIRLRE